MTDNAVLEELWARFGHIAKTRVDVLAGAVTALVAHVGDETEPPAVAHLRERAREECHKLVGALDSYGRTGGSALAGRAEQLLMTRPTPAELGLLVEARDGLLGLFDSTGSEGA